MNVAIHFGALALKLSEQLKDFQIGANDLAHFQMDADAITRLAIRGLITDSMKTQAHKKLLKNIVEKLEGK